MEPISKYHPDEMCLLSYLDSPRSEDVKDVCRHLVDCVSCREYLVKTQSMMGALKQYAMLESDASSYNHPDDLAIANYVDGRAGSRQDEEIRAHVDGCGLCTKRALHYALHSAELRREMSESSVLQESESTPPLSPLPQGEGKQKKSFYHCIFSWRIPVWFGVPATAFATAILVFILVGQDRKDVGQRAQTAQQENAKIVLAYQENPQITILSKKGKTPGIGFFSQSRGETKPFGGLTVKRISGNQYRISWPPIEGVVTYDIRIFTPGPVETRSYIASITGVRETSIIMDLSSLEPGERYLWELTGYMNDNKRFMTSGGFVVALYP